MQHLRCENKPSLFQVKALKKLFAAFHTFPIEYLSAMDLSVLPVQLTTHVGGNFYQFSDQESDSQRNDPFQVASVCMRFQHKLRNSLYL